MKKLSIFFIIFIISFTSSFSLQAYSSDPKEFVREWLMENNFQGKKGQNIPEMTNNIVKSISERYIELYENIIGEKFIKRNTENMLNDIESNIKIAL